MLFLAEPSSAQDASDDKSNVRIEVDQAATKVLREWVVDAGEIVSAVRVESPNLEFAFRVNGKFVGKWKGETSLSDGYSDDDYRKTIYDFCVMVISERKTNSDGKTIISASSKIRINTRQGLGAQLDSLTAELTAQTPENGVLWSDSEWFNKSKPWTTPLPKRTDDDFVTIWRKKLENYVDRKIVETEDAPTIELVARRVR